MECKCNRSGAHIESNTTSRGGAARVVRITVGEYVSVRSNSYLNINTTSGAGGPGVVRITVRDYVSVRKGAH